MIQPFQQSKGKTLILLVPLVLCIILGLSVWLTNILLNHDIAKSQLLFVDAKLRFEALSSKQGNLEVKNARIQGMHTLVRINHFEQTVHYFNPESGGWVDIGETGYVTIPNNKKDQRNVEEHRAWMKWLRCYQENPDDSNACKDLFPVEYMNDAKNREEGKSTND